MKALPAFGSRVISNVMMCWDMLHFYSYKQWERTPRPPPGHPTSASFCHRLLLTLVSLGSTASRVFQRGLTLKSFSPCLCHSTCVSISWGHGVMQPLAPNHCQHTHELPWVTYTNTSSPHILRPCSSHFFFCRLTFMASHTWFSP